MMRDPHPPETRGANGEPRAWVLAALGVLVATSFAIYANSLQGAFVFDDLSSIRDNGHLRSFTPLSRVLNGPPGSGSSGRPLVALSLAVNHALGGLDVLGYHLFNVLVHALASLALFGLVRRSLAETAVRERAFGIAFATALLWTVHPLHTDALDHVVYRNEAMGSLFYLLAMYTAVRGFRSERRARWFALSALSCSLAMASKELAISAPLAVLALDRTLFSASFREALRGRLGLYLGLAAGWGVLAAAILSGDRGASAGFGQEIVSSFDYLRIQSWVIVHYLRLAVWPEPLLFDYFDWPIPTSITQALPQGLLLSALLGVSLWLFAKRRAVGFLGLLFFAVLAPSSSLYPLSGEIAGEHRMYLALAPVLLLLILGANRLVASPAAARVALAIVVLAAGALAWRTVVRNEAYRSIEILWGGVLERYPDHARAHRQLGANFLQLEELDKAHYHCQKAVEAAPGLAKVDRQLATVLMRLGRNREAEPHFERALLRDPGDAEAYSNHGTNLERLGRLDDAERSYRKAIELDPHEEVTLCNLATLLIDQQRFPEAAELSRRAIEVEPDYVSGYHNLGASLLAMGRAAEAVPELRRAAELEPEVSRRQEVLALALETAGDARGAIEHYREALRLDPGNQRARKVVVLLAAHPNPALRDGREALRLAQALVARAPRESAELLDLLAMAQAELGRFDAAKASAGRALELSREAGLEAVAREIQARIARYEARQPYRL